MALDYFDSRLLTGTVTKMEPQYDLFTSLFFNHQAPVDTDVLELHIETESQELASLVNKHEGGQVIEFGNGKVVLVEAPRFRMKMLYRAANMIRNGIGYTPYDREANPIERKISEDLMKARRRVDNSTEYMSSGIVTSGKITIVNNVEGVSTTMYEVNNGMPDSHKITLTTTALWSASTSSIMDNVEAWAMEMQENGGPAPTDLVLGSNVWPKFYKHADVKDNLDIRRIDLGSLTPKVQSKFKGVWNGLNIWAYAGKVKGYSGDSVNYLDPDSIVLGSNSPDNVIEHAQPIDLVCTGPTQFFAKTFDQDDPSATFLVVEARPLPWARRPETFLCAKVL